MTAFQDLGGFRLPPGFRGRPAWVVQLWWLVQATLFRGSPQVLYGWRRFLLRCFGCRLGPGVLIRPSATITYPWKVTIGAHCWIGDDVVLYSLGEIRVGANTAISQRAYLCAASRDHTRREFPIRAAPVTLEDEVWIATDVFVGPGVTIGRGAVVGARSSVFADLPGGMVALGTPARPVRPRTMVDD